ncbi:MAG: flagellar basal body-associated FliL family protein [Desulfovibrio sp.]|uniref:flagellar basal body-associated FliL family protein n=1 Tax=Desulfovibrio sp. 7SRBS1 TaxID=3378064 RepID=UPI003B3F5489
MSEEETQQEAPRKKFGFLKWLILLLLLLILAGGGYYVYAKFFAAPGDGADKPVAEESQKDKGSGEVQGFKDLVTLPTFVVNLADPLGRRYLKLSMDVEVTDEEASKKLTNSEAQVRDAIILLLSSKSFQDLSTIEDKIMLKKQVVERLNQVLGGPKVLRVYFTEMVVQ